MANMSYQPPGGKPDYLGMMQQKSGGPMAPKRIDYSHPTLGANPGNNEPNDVGNHFGGGGPMPLGPDRFGNTGMPTFDANGNSTATTRGTQWGGVGPDPTMIGTVGGALDHNGPTGGVDPVNLNGPGLGGMGGGPTGDAPDWHSQTPMPLPPQHLWNYAQDGNVGRPDMAGVLARSHAAQSSPSPYPQGGGGFGGGGALGLPDLGGAQMLGGPSMGAGGPMLGKRIDYSHPTPMAGPPMGGGDQNTGGGGGPMPLPPHRWGQPQGGGFTQAHSDFLNQLRQRAGGRFSWFKPSGM